MAVYQFTQHYTHLHTSTHDNPYGYVLHILHIIHTSTHNTHILNYTAYTKHNTHTGYNHQNYKLKPHISHYIQVLGAQTLADLRDCILCNNDNILVDEVASPASVGNHLNIRRTTKVCVKWMLRL